MRNVSILMRVVMIAALLGLVASPVQSSEVSGPAPDFTLKSNQGKNLKLSEHRGEVILLNFWASWCGPCRQEMPELEKLQARYQDYGFTILGVNVEEDSSKADGVLRKTPVSFPILYDTSNKVSKVYDVRAMPSTVMIDRDGNMRYLHKGYVPGDEAEYAKWIKKLIRE